MNECERRKCPAWTEEGCSSEWECPECGNIGGCCVNEDETCDTCGRQVYQVPTLNKK